ncbi:hypothetical protein [Polaromonas sp. YR568]|uniref:hypothetical protein n=1 Tax=Polaromonas sp. YR568 TaxID=1855301 RepID=UPI0031377BF7
MLDRIHNLPITGLYDFSERYKLVKRTGDDLERDKLIEVAYLAIRAIEQGHRDRYLLLRTRLAAKVIAGGNGARIFYDRKSRTTRTWDDLILAHTTAEIAASAFLATEVFEGWFSRTVNMFRGRERLTWRWHAKNEMFYFRCKRVIKCPEFDDAFAKSMLDLNAWVKPRCLTELAAEEALEIENALDERNRLQRQYSMQDAEEDEGSDEDPHPSPWLTAGVSGSAGQSVMRL